MDVGIVSHGLYLPAGFETAADLAVKTGLSEKELLELGMARKCRPSDGDQPVAMASRAAARALESTPDVSPADIDVVMYTGEEYKDYIAQTAAIRLQEEAGCRNAYAFDLVGQGVSMILGLRLARDLMIGDEAVDTVLLAGGTRNLDLVDVRRRDTRFLLPYSASGAALIVRRNHPVNRLLSVTVQVDPEMADAVYVPGGGTAMPFAKDNLGSAAMFYQVMEPETLEGYLQKRWAGRLAGITRAATAGDRPDFLSLRHLPPAERARVLDELGLRPDQSPDLFQFGHHGTNDVIIALDLGLRSGTIRPGSLVALTTGGIGFTYASAAIQWG